MPLVFKQNLTEGVLALWKIEENETDLNALCSMQEQEYAAHFTAPHRRREWLAWHALLHTVTPGAESIYQASGAPTLLEGGHIGVSHTHGYAAIITGKHPCAIDIELSCRDFSKAASKFISPAETVLTQGDHRVTGKIWCAKEALYKWADIPESDFIRDIRIENIDPSKRTLYGSIHTHEITLHDYSTESLLMICCMGPLNP